MQVAGYLDALHVQGQVLAEAAGQAGLDAPVPTCPPWRVRDLLRHTGYIHRWAARHIIERPASVLDGPDEAEILRGGAHDDGLIEWFLAGHAALVQTLATADPALECGAFMAAPSPLAFWARRQAHETAIHRADAQSAAGTRPEYLAEFAADGIDELIMGFGRRRKYAPVTGADGGLLHVLAADTGDGWQVEVTDGRLQPRRVPGHDHLPRGSACTVSGPACALYLFLWNRSGPAGIAISGDRSVLTSWQSGVQVRWS